MTWTEPRLELRSCDTEYIFNIMRDLARAERKNDVERILVYTSELEKFKLLCGFDPRLEAFQEAIIKTVRNLNLQNNPTIQRSLNAPYCTGETPKKPHKHMLIGFDVVNLYPDGKTEFCTEPEPKRCPIPQPPIEEVRFLSRNQNRLKQR